MMSLLLAAWTAAVAAETRLTIPSDAGAPAGFCALGATLDRPAGARAVVVFVHGSGTHDRDETVGRVKPFRDLAEGLSARGIASLRYDKRGFDRACLPGLLHADVSPSHFISDIAAAVDRAGQEGLPVFLLGHSEGATYAAEAVVSGLARPRGLVLLAGLGRYAIDETLLRQLEAAIARIDSRLSDGALPRPQREELEAARGRVAGWLAEGRVYFARIRDGRAAPTERFMGGFARFWAEQVAMTARAAATAARLDIPAMLVQGAADLNLTKDDFDALEAALAPRGGVSLYLPGLDHLFVRQGSDRMDPAVPDAVAGWIESQLPPRPGAGLARSLSVEEPAFP